MKVDLKIICIVLVALCLAVESEGWLIRTFRSSRRIWSSSNSNSNSSSSISSSRSSSSIFTTRRVWLIQRRLMPRLLRLLPFRKSRTKTSVPKTTQAPVTTSSIGTSPTICTAHILGGCIETVSECVDISSLFDDILACTDKWRVSLQKAPKEALWKNVTEVQLVERPMGKCGLKYENEYDEKTISCLHRYSVKTSILGKTDRVMHSGVVVTTTDGSKYLIHKGKSLKRIIRQTKVEEVENKMFENYEIIETIKPKRLREVREYKIWSGPFYDFIIDNCHDATLKMRDLANSNSILYYGP